MKTTDFDVKISADKMNETMFKKFGSKINFSKYTREELENYRNILRTKLHQTETQSKFNELLSNETYQRDKQVLDILNTKIKEMLGERKLSKAELKKREEIAQAIGRDHPEMKMSKKMAIATAQAKKSADEGIKETEMKTTEAKKSKGDGNLANNYPPYDKVTRGDVIAGRLGKDQKGGKKVKEETGKFDKVATTWTDKSGKKHPAQRVTRKTDQLAQGEEDKPKEKKVKEGLPMVKGPDGKMVPKFAADGKGKHDLKKKKVKESHFRLHVRLVNESLKFLIREDEEGKAKAITAASDMVNDYTTWMQRVGQYQTKSMIELADAIRAEFGQAEADAFKNAIAPALASTLDTLTTQREIISHAVAVLAGEATDMAPMGTEPGVEPGMGDAGLDAAPEDSMNPPEDEFAASDAAAGGAETSGRETRESREERRLRRIQESHSIISKLAK